MERRSFLKAIMAISAGTFVSPAMASDIGSGNRYQRLITAQHRAILSLKAYHANGSVAPADAQSLIYQRVLEEGRAVFKILQSEFTGEPKDADFAQAQVYLLINDLFVVDSLSEQELRQIEDVVATAVVTRSLIRDHAAPFNGANVRELNTLAQRIRPYMFGPLTDRARTFVQQA